MTGSCYNYMFWSASKFNIYLFIIIYFFGWNIKNERIDLLKITL